MVDPWSDSDDGEVQQQLMDGQEEVEWDEWAGEGSDAGDDAAVSLFEDKLLPSVAAALDYDAATHGFDLRAFIRQVHSARLNDGMLDIGGGIGVS